MDGDEAAEALAGETATAADGSSVELTKVDGSTCTFTMVRQAVVVAAVFTASKTTNTDGALKPGTNTVTYRQGMGTGRGVISGPMGGLVVGGPWIGPSPPPGPRAYGGWRSGPTGPERSDSRRISRPFNRTQRRPDRSTCELPSRHTSVSNCLGAKSIGRGPRGAVQSKAQMRRPGMEGTQEIFP